MKKIFFLFLFLPTLVSAQSFGTDATVKYVQKLVTAITPPHEYFQLYNYSGDSLLMRWRIVDSLTYYHSGWDVALQDKNTYQNPIIDSADFILPDTAGSLDKIIINIFPNGFIGYGEIVIELINLDSLPEKIRIKFQIEILPGPNNIEETIFENDINVFPNPGHNNLSLVSTFPITKIEIIDLLGRIIQVQLINSLLNVNVEINKLSNSSYYLRVYKEDEIIILPFIKQ